MHTGRETTQTESDRPASRWCLLWSGQQAMREARQQSAAAPLAGAIAGEAAAVEQRLGDLEHAIEQERQVTIGALLDLEERLSAGRGATASSRTRRASSSPAARARTASSGPSGCPSSSPRRPGRRRTPTTRRTRATSSSRSSRRTPTPSSRRRRRARRGGRRRAASRRRRARC